MCEATKNILGITGFKKISRGKKLTVSLMFLCSERIATNAGFLLQSSFSAVWGSLDFLPSRLKRLSDTYEV